MPEPYTVGILGAGNIVANMHLPTLLAMPEVRVAWIYDGNLARARRLSETFEVPAHGAPRDPTDLPAADIVLIAIPYGVREPYFKALCTRPTALYVEKPLARTVEQHLRYQQWFGGPRLAVGYQRRAWGSVKLMQQLIAEGMLGPLRRIRVQHGVTGQLTGSPYGSDFGLAGGGMLFEVGVHWIDLALVIAGVRATQMVDGRMIRQDQFDLHTEARFEADMPGNEAVPLEILVSGLTETRNTIEMHGEHATLVLHQAGGKVTLECLGHPLEVELMSRLQAYPSTPFQMCHATWQGMVHGLRSGTSNWTTASSSLLTTQVIENLYGLPS